MEHYNQLVEDQEDMALLHHLLLMVVQVVVVDMLILQEDHQLLDKDLQVVVEDRDLHHILAVAVAALVEKVVMV